MSIAVLTTYVLVVLGLMVIPGPATLLVLARSVSGGRRAGIATGLGIGVGDLIHSTMATFGLSALLATSALAFEVVKYIGVAYLIYLGYRAFIERSGNLDMAAAPEISPGKAFRQGIFTEILNPKTALFFLALLPQFVDVHAGSAALQMILLGVVFVALGVVSDGAYALAAGSVGAWARRRPLAVRAQRWVSGGVLVGLGVATALGDSGRRK
jgi:threonine/homoserine/homoserine lactone efflux protein